jgi:hypothetical protein
VRRSGLHHGRNEVDPIRRTILRAPIFMRAVDG